MELRKHTPPVSGCKRSNWSHWAAWGVASPPPSSGKGQSQHFVPRTKPSSWLLPLSPNPQRLAIFLFSPSLTLYYLQGNTRVKSNQSPGLTCLWGFVIRTLLS